MFCVVCSFGEQHASENFIILCAHTTTKSFDSDLHLYQQNLLLYYEELS